MLNSPPTPSNRGWWLVLVIFVIEILVLRQFVLPKYKISTYIAPSQQPLSINLQISRLKPILEAQNKIIFPVIISSNQFLVKNLPRDIASLVFPNAMKVSVEQVIYSDKRTGLVITYDLPVKIADFTKLLKSITFGSQISGTRTEVLAIMDYYSNTDKMSLRMMVSDNGSSGSHVAIQILND